MKTQFGIALTLLAGVGFGGLTAWFNPHRGNLS
jgi:hypothetical protein